MSGSAPAIQRLPRRPFRGSHSAPNSTGWQHRPPDIASSHPLEPISRAQPGRFGPFLAIWRLPRSPPRVGGFEAIAKCVFEGVFHPHTAAAPFSPKRDRNAIRSRVSGPKVWESAYAMLQIVEVFWCVYLIDTRQIIGQPNFMGQARVHLLQPHHAHHSRMGPTTAAAVPDIPLSVVALGLALGVANIFIFYPLLLRFLPGLRYFGPLHHRPISDIPVRLRRARDSIFGCLGRVMTDGL